MLSLMMHWGWLRVVSRRGRGIPEVIRVHSANPFGNKLTTYSHP